MKIFLFPSERLKNFWKTGNSMLLAKSYHGLTTGSTKSQLIHGNFQYSHFCVGPVLVYCPLMMLLNAAHTLCLRHYTRSPMCSVMDVLLVGVRHMPSVWIPFLTQLNYERTRIWSEQQFLTSSQPFSSHLCFSWKVWSFGSFHTE